MSINIVEEVQAKMGYQPIIKIDPNTQDTKESETGENLLQQSATASVLCGIYEKYNQPEININWGTISTSLLDEIFGDSKNEVITSVANYSKVGTNKATEEMEKVAATINEIIKEQVAEPTQENIKAFIHNQRHNILVHLPPDLKMGELLKDNTIDDRTNKMEGPVSGLMHAIEKVFSSND